MNALRPLSLGEILDRGFAVWLKTSPKAIRVIVPAVAGVIVVVAVEAYSPEDYRIACSLLALLGCGVVVLFSMCGIAYLYAREASGQPCSSARAIAAARERFFPAVAFALLSIVSLVVLAAAAMALLFAGVFAEGHVLPRGAIASIFGSMLVAGFVLAALILYGIVSVIQVMGLIACVFEPLEPLASLRTTLFRVSRKSQRRRTLSLGLAIVAPGLVIGFIAGLINAFVMTHAAESWYPVATFLIGALTTSVQFVTLLLAYAWAAVQYFDARVRLEGLDLVALADA